MCFYYLRLVVKPNKNVDIIIPHKGRNKALKHAEAHLPIISSCNENKSELYDCGNKSIWSYLVEIWKKKIRAVKKSINSVFHFHNVFIYYYSNFTILKSWLWFWWKIRNFILSGKQRREKSEKQSLSISNMIRMISKNGLHRILYSHTTLSSTLAILSSLCIDFWIIVIHSDADY